MSDSSFSAAVIMYLTFGIFLFFIIIASQFRLLIRKQAEKPDSKLILHAGWPHFGWRFAKTVKKSINESSLFRPQPQYCLQGWGPTPSSTGINYRAAVVDSWRVIDDFCRSAKPSLARKHTETPSQFMRRLARDIGITALDAEYYIGLYEKARFSNQPWNADEFREIQAATTPFSSKLRQLSVEDDDSGVLLQ